MSKFPVVFEKSMADPHILDQGAAAPIQNAARVSPITGTFACKPFVGQ
jgi:hypothetical protein